MVLFIPTIFLNRGRWSPKKAHEDEEKHDADVAEELEELVGRTPEPPRGGCRPADPIGFSVGSAVRSRSSSWLSRLRADASGAETFVELAAAVADGGPDGLGQEAHGSRSGSIVAPSWSTSGLGPLALAGSTRTR